MTTFNSPTPHLFAHRGGNAAGAKIENTIKAFESSSNLGYKFLETDVIVTKDGQVINYHGSANFLTRLIFGLELRKKVQKLTYKQVQTSVNMGGQPVPKFDSVLSHFEDKCFCVDVKTKEAVEPLVQVIKKQKAQNRVIITSFSRKRSIQANKLLRGEGFTEACLCAYSLKGYFIAVFPRLFLSGLKKQGFGYIHIPYRCITKKLMKEAKKQQIKIYAWTVNDEKQIKKLLSWGVDGIISDETKLLLRSK